ncbi:cytochrome c oxidase assembly protein COX16 homolog, mitochondrial [Pectinophora gossypiella]|uniref:cytochrome c oxidase assembly protein COX16 homolog, mitochondrial n=1 Tax=Pectinophora gossypiella TaxID=13191 RepID=UPI00214E62F2|nr:cytochrome c oxidase assembly protein COX16 homolog, mitochondrial [Pectinophora gossypiella]
MFAKDNKFFAYINSLQTSFNIVRKRRSFKYGVPFILFVVGGSFGLREWTQIRYQFSQVKGVSREQAEKMGLNKAKEVTLEDTYEEIQKLDIDNWENKRGPRPWELQEQKSQKK